MGRTRSGSACGLLTKRPAVHIAWLLTAVGLDCLVKVSPPIIAAGGDSLVRMPPQLNTVCRQDLSNDLWQVKGHASRLTCTCPRGSEKWGDNKRKQAREMNCAIVHSRKADYTRLTIMILMVSNFPFCTGLLCVSFFQISENRLYCK